MASMGTDLSQRRSTTPSPAPSNGPIRTAWLNLPSMNTSFVSPSVSTLAMYALDHDGVPAAQEPTYVSDGAGGLVRLVPGSLPAAGGDRGLDNEFILRRLPPLCINEPFSRHDWNAS